MRGGIGALAGLCIVLIVGWLRPIPATQLQIVAYASGALIWCAAMLGALAPVSHGRRAADLDARLGTGDRIATAWVFRESAQSIAKLQRADALRELERLSTTSDLQWRPARRELAVVAACFLVSLVLIATPSPQQVVLQQQAAEEAGVSRAADQIEALRQDALDPAVSLTPEQAQRLNELLQQAQAELKQVRSQQEATAILAATAEQLNQQLSDGNASVRDEALAAMSETLAAEPLTRSLAAALQHEDAQAMNQAMSALVDQTDRLTDGERQALSRALQRAANVGRADPASAAALSQAARALAAGQPSTTTAEPTRSGGGATPADRTPDGTSPSQANQDVQASQASQANGATQANRPGQASGTSQGTATTPSQAGQDASQSRAALLGAEAALTDAIRAARAQAAVNATAERLRDVQARLVSGASQPGDDSSSLPTSDEQSGGGLSSPQQAGLPVPIDGTANGLLSGLRDPASQPGGGAGLGPGASQPGSSSNSDPGAIAAENVFVPGRQGSGASDPNLIDQPFTVRGGPRAYRDVLGQYAQSNRDYVDRADVPPAVRDMVKEYFVKLEEGQ